ncbi:MAG: 2-amino-3-carboxymuconate-6-semialdehyde decarboxylase-like protein [Betaproteobacteria bacterium]|nr:2-amino-3-carboxymuconate-6-semialdehyde decarboxylase-like protein [Betaproteobacteria bacterium]
MQKAIDVHSHMLCQEWLDLFKANCGPRFTIQKVVGGAEVIHYDGVAFMTPQPTMFDYPARLAAMDKAGVGMAILSLTGPNVYWGDAKASSRAASAINDSFAEASGKYPDRIKWMASLPMQFPDKALEELDRATKKGAVGVVVLANVGGASLTDPLFEPIWEEIDKRELPVFVHPTVPCGCGDMDMQVFQLSASVGFTMDTTLAVSRMIYDGFFDRYSKLKLITAHGGGTLPFLAPRLDRCHEVVAACRTKIKNKPSTYLKRIYADTCIYSSEALRSTIEAFGEEHVLYGTDFPHNISDMEGTLARIEKLEPTVRDNVRGANAQRVFRL